MTFKRSPPDTVPAIPSPCVCVINDVDLLRSDSFMWNCDTNSSATYPQFHNEIGKYPTKGSWKQDYEHYCQQQHLIPCPFIKIEQILTSETKTLTICKVMNCLIDIGSWRAMLVACSTIGNTIIEIYIHNVRLTSQHLQDLGILFKSLSSTTESIQCLKLNYIEVIDEDPEVFFSSTLKQFLSLNSIGLKYLSLVGNQIHDQILTELLIPLRNHSTLLGINLNQNQITDQGFISLLGMLPYALQLNAISCKANHLTGHSLTQLLQLFHGYTVTTDGENEIKALNKLVQERNKSIKDMNKRIKKELKDAAGGGGGGTSLNELNELEPVSNRVVKTQESSLIFNHSLRFLDLSWNETITAEDLLSFQDHAMIALSSSLSHPSSPRSTSPTKDVGKQSSHLEKEIAVLTLCLRGLGGEEMTEMHRDALNQETFSGRLKVVM
jgi:hypothetical protein